MVSDPASQSPAIQLDIAGAFLQIGDADVMREMLSMMVELLATETLKIASSLQAGDLSEVVGSLHSLKGSIPIFCTPSVIALVEQSELTAKSGDVAQAHADFLKLKPMLQQLGDEIVQFLCSATPQS